MASLQVEIVTPEAALFSGEATSLVARSSAGEFMVLPGHTATVGDVVPGIVRVHTAEGEIAFAVHGGYFQIASAVEGVTLTTVLAGVAEKVADIDVARATAAKERLELELASATQANPDDHAPHLAAHAALARAELRLRAAAK